MGLQTWSDFPGGIEGLKKRDYAAVSSSQDGQWFDVRGFADFGSAPPSASIGNSDRGDFSLQTIGSPGGSNSSSTTYDGSSFAGNGDTSAEQASLSSYLMDGHVRAMLKKVTVNEGTLNQIIQSLGGGEKGLKELMAYVMSCVRDHKGENSERFSFSPNFENLQNPSPVSPVFGYAASSCSPSLGGEALDRLYRVDTAHDLNQFNQPCTKSRRLMSEGAGADSSRRSHDYRNRGTSVDMRGTLPEEFQYPKLETSTGYYSSIGPNMLPGMIHKFQQPIPSLGSESFSVASGQDDLTRTLAATTRAARRNRIARQREAAQPGLPRAGTAPPSAYGIWSVAPPTFDLRNTGMFQMAPAAPPAGGARKANNADMLTFLLQKELRPSDVGNLGRIILPKKEAEMHLPILALREGVLLQMEDFDSGYRWNIRYRFWPNNKSRMYLLENTGELVKSHNLQEGDLLILYRNQQGNYVLRGKKKVHSESRGGAQGSQQRNAHSLARGFSEASKMEEVLRKQRDFGMGVESDWSCQKALKERDLGLESEDPSCHKAVKAEPTILVGDDDPFFKEDVMHNIGSTFGPGLLQPLERFPSFNLDFPLDEIMASIPKEDDDSTESDPNLGSTVGVVPKTEPTA